MQRAGRAEAAAVIWGEAREAAPEGSGRERRRGSIQAALVAALGLGLRWFGLEAAGLAALCAAALLLTAALLSPRGVYALVSRAVSALGTRIGRGVTWLLLVPLFYVFFAPYGALLRRGARDRLKRRLEPDAASYWEPIEGPTAASASYETQW